MIDINSKGASHESAKPKTPKEALESFRRILNQRTKPTPESEANWFNTALMVADSIDEEDVIRSTEVAKNTLEGARTDDVEYLLAEISSCVDEQEKKELMKRVTVYRYPLMAMRDYQILIAKSNGEDSFIDDPTFADLFIACRRLGEIKDTNGNDHEALVNAKKSIDKVRLSPPEINSSNTNILGLRRAIRSRLLMGLNSEHTNFSPDSPEYHRIRKEYRRAVIFLTLVEVASPGKHKGLAESLPVGIGVNSRIGYKRDSHL